MRYRVNGFEIRSENAAKPIGQASKNVLRWISENVHGGMALDYGCGKLRYARILAERCANLTLVDSTEQLDRLQMIDGENTSVREYASNRWNHATILTIKEFRTAKNRYDFVLCANVLSAIPCATARNEAIRQIARGLSPKGRALFVTQFRNSDFKKASRLPDSVPHLDGWILRTLKGTFYYGLLPLPRLRAIVTRNRCRVHSGWTEGQSAFLLIDRAHVPNRDAS